jgi:hypothetical protein
MCEKRMAGRASLAFLGRDDISLSGDPEVTYFLEKYPTETRHFSIMNKVQFTDEVRFGDTSSVDLPNMADLITKVILKVNLPVLTSDVLDSVGTLMIDYAELVCDGKTVERLYGEYMAIKNDLMIPQGQQASLLAMVGKAGIANSRNLSTYTVPLDFSCIRKGLPLCALRKSQLAIRVTFRDALDFTFPQIIYFDPVDAFLEIEYTYLSENEIKFLEAKPLTYVFEQVQYVENEVGLDSDFIRIFPNWANPVKEVFIVIQNVDRFGYDYTTDGTHEQLIDLTLKLNGVDRIPREVGSALYLRVIQAMEYHTRLPTSQFYMYSFCLDPEHTRPTGSINMSRIQNQVLDLNLNSSASPRIVRLYAVNYNFFEVAEGRGKVLFAN